MFHSLGRALRTFSKKKRVRQLSEAKISLNEEPSSQPLEPEVNRPSYLELRETLSNLGWQTMDFHKLCSLPTATIDAIEMQIKKDKFNVDDNEFYHFGEGQVGSNFNNISKLNIYYQRTMALITNDHQIYDQLRPSSDFAKKFLGELYVYELVKDKQLQAVITYFINNLQFPNLLEAEAQPTLVKRLLMLKRELMIQGIRFESMKSRKEVSRAQQKLKKEQKMLESKNYSKDNEEPMFGEQNEGEDLNENFDFDLDEVSQRVNLNNRLSTIMQEVGKYNNQVKIKEVLGYQYEFWVDVKHNRAKNGQPEDYVIEDRIIDNPNETLLLSKYPKIPVKYIVHKRKRKGYTMHFCVKAQLLILINDRHSRRVKIEWKGPSNKPSDEPTDFRVIDYENMMNGNPTIKSVFQF